jgi:hypothetical protein
MNKIFYALVVSIFIIIPVIFAEASNWSPLPDTGQNSCYDIYGDVISCPQRDEPWYGQDAQYDSPSQQYHDNTNGTITDNLTGLIWQQDYVGPQSWYDSVTYCNNLKLAGYDDWRLPTYFELLSIVNYGLENPSINSIFICASLLYWSSSELISNNISAWYVSFYGGHSGFMNKSEHRNTRCVRN